MTRSEYSILNGSKHLIISFGGMALLFGGIPPFEFLTYLSSTYKNDCDLVFYIDSRQCWYHKGIEHITTGIDETAAYLDELIKRGNYDKVIFMGVSAGGYASILFGSLCHVNHVLAFIPQTYCRNPIDEKYANLKHIINARTRYVLYGDTSIEDVNDIHHISHCENIECFANVRVIRNHGCDMKQLRDTGFIKQRIDDVIGQ
jgi:predicted esterase YcpF (UPF0227 family)